MTYIDGRDVNLAPQGGNQRRLGDVLGQDGDGGKRDGIGRKVWFGGVKGRGKRKTS